jgi:hypothetical protein
MRVYMLLTHRGTSPFIAEVWSVSATAELAEQHAELAVPNTHTWSVQEHEVIGSVGSEKVTDEPGR